jgi:AraC-like DNA-binding protein
MGAVIPPDFVKVARREHPAIGVVLLCRLMRELGHDPDPMLRAEGLPAFEDLRPTTLIDAARDLGFLLRAIKAVPVPELGLLAGQRHHVSIFGMWGLAMVSSATLNGAIQIGLRFIDLTHTFLRWRLVKGPGAPRLRLDEPFELGPARMFLIERDLAAAVTLLQDLLGHRRALAEIVLPFPRPAHAAVYDEVLGCPVTFGQDAAEAVIRPDSLNAPPLQANPAAAALAEQQCAELAARMSGEGRATAAVRRQILAVPGEFPSLAEIARRLHLSERGLRRRLAAEDTGYRHVMDEVRETLARAYLRDTGLQVEEIAERLGYSDAANFTHAFRRWTGSAPGRFRSDAAFLSGRRPS